jgi:hypothetical protein
MRVRITWWKPWADRSTTRAEKSAEGDLAGAIQDARALLLEGRPVVLEPLEDIPHKDQVRLEQVPAWKTLGHWAGCSCPTCAADRARRFP